MIRIALFLICFFSSAAFAAGLFFLAVTVLSYTPTEKPEEKTTP